MSPQTRISRTTLLVVLAAVLGGALAVWRRLPPPPVDLLAHERNVFSLTGEDGILEGIFQVVGTENRTLVDLGAGDGQSGSSSRNLIENHGWGGLLVEAGSERARRLGALYEGHPSARTLHALVDPGDIEIHLERHGVPRAPDLLIVGLKANDWYVWRGIRDFEARVVQIQYNAAFVPPQTMVIEYHPLNFWDGALYFGASIQSLVNLGQDLGYELVYANSAGTNLFFVKADLFGRFGILDNDPARLYRPNEQLPRIPPTRVRDWMGPTGEPLPPQPAELIVEGVTVPRTWVFDLVEAEGGS